MTSENASLEQIRREIDQIDDSLHDLLMRRTVLVEQVAVIKAASGVALRPGREASILRRLDDRHQGSFPRPALVRIWREIMGALVGLQKPFSVAVSQSERGSGYLELARDHFGVVAPQVVHPSPGHVVRDVADGVVAVGVVPMPSPADIEPWWLSLTADADNLPRVVVRLPALVQESPAGRSEPLEAFVLACRDPEPTGDDRTLVAVETMPDLSRDRLRALMSAAGLEATQLLATHRADDRWLHLAEVDGAIARDDPRVEQLLAGGKDAVRHVRIIGGYPVSLPA
jgi:chorismate mutase/prephenate dehydratase